MNDRKLIMASAGAVIKLEGKLKAERDAQSVLNSNVHNYEQELPELREIKEGLRDPKL